MTRRDLDNLVRVLADGQHRVFTFKQVERFGVNRALASRRVLAGVWERPYPNVFRLPGARTPDGDALAAAWSFKRALNSHDCAARLLRIPESDPRCGPEVVVERNGYQPRPFPVHEVRWLPRCDRATVGPNPVTTLARTLADLCAVWPEVRLRKAWEGAITEGRTSPARLQTAAVPLIGRGHPRSETVRALLERCDDHQPVPTESELEHLLLDVLIAGRYGPVSPQVPLEPLGGVKGRCDFFADHVGAILEADGRRWHTRIEDFERDRRRDNRLQAAGYNVFRFTHHELTEQRSEVIRVLDGHYRRKGLERDRSGGWRRAA